MKPLVIDAHGTDRDIGRQHALGAAALRQGVVQWVEAVLADHPPGDAIVRRRVEEVRAAWQELTPQTLDQVAGMAEVYGLDEDYLLIAALGTYFRSLDRSGGAAEGCTTLALGNPRPLLAKNRDNDRRFLGLQTVLRAKPAQGHPWLALSTAGAPGVHSSGMNTAGLAVADTHVPSSDVGPGVPRYASMMHILEQCSSTAEAVDYLQVTPQMGLGNITVVDAQGSTAVVECGYRTAAVRWGIDAETGTTPVAAVATNHYATPVLAECLLEADEGTPGANSRARFAAVTEFLSGVEGEATTRQSADTALKSMQRLFASHAGGENGTGEVPGSICQHGPSLRSETVSTAIYDPIGGHLDLCLGWSCAGTYHRIPVE